MIEREELNKKGDLMRTEVGAFGSDIDTVPGFQRMLTEVVYGGILAMDVLSLQDRYICVLTSLMLKQNKPQLQINILSALKVGLSPRTILEIFLQAGLYGGFPTAENAMKLAHKVFSTRNICIESENEDNETIDKFYDIGNNLLSFLHGTRGSEGYASPDNSTAKPLYEIAIAYGYGWLWHRPGLDKRQRMICAISSFTVLQLDHQIRKFGKSALTTGLNKGEVIEVVIQTAPYSGFPPALNALSILDLSLIHI